MTETFPRWGLDPVDYVETDATTIESEIITGYEKAAGRTLAAGDPVRLFLLHIAAVIIQQRSVINIAAQQNTLAYAQGRYLDALGLNVAVERLPASAAVTTLRFTLSQAMAEPYVIPADTEVGNGVVTFVTDEELVIKAGDLYADVGATCTTTGEGGNGYLPGQVSTIVKPLPFIAGAKNTTTTSGGSDTEDDERFAERIRTAPNSYSVAGPRRAYIYHAKSVSPAIIDVQVASPSPGVVNVYPLLEGGELPGSDVLSLVEEHLNDETIRPLTDEVHAVAPTGKAFTINVKYWINTKDLNRSQTIQENVKKAVEAYRLWQTTAIGRDIVPSKLLAAVINAEAMHVDASTLSPSEYVKLEDGEVAQCAGVTVTYAGSRDE